MSSVCCCWHYLAPEWLTKIHTNNMVVDKLDARASHLGQGLSEALVLPASRRLLLELLAGEISSRHLLSGWDSQVALNRLPLTLLIVWLIIYNALGYHS